MSIISFFFSVLSSCNDICFEFWIGASRFFEHEHHTSLCNAEDLPEGMWVGSKFGETTFKLGSMLSDAQVGRLKDRSASAMSTFGDILPMQASGLFSSLTATRSDS